jgi:hypothetical protein
LKPYINASRFHKQQPGERRAKEIYRDTPLLEQSKTILVHLGWALPAQSFQTSIQFPGSQAERREEVLLRCEWSKLQTLLRSRAKQQGSRLKTGLLHEKTTASASRRFHLHIATSRKKSSFGSFFKHFHGKRASITRLQDKGTITTR